MARYWEWDAPFTIHPEETALLEQPAYQMKIAAVIAAGYCQYCTNEGTT